TRHCGRFRQQEERMAIVRIYEFPGGTLEQYDAVMAQFDNQLAPGNLLHAAGTGEGPGFRAVDVFDSAEAAAGVEAALGEAAASVGLERPQVSASETHNLLRG